MGDSSHHYERSASTVALQELYSSFMFLLSFIIALLWESAQVVLECEV